MDARREIKKNDQGPAYALTRAEEANDHHMATTLPIESTNATGTHLDQLNDYCLLEIFSEKSLTPMDLCALAETCKLFKRITQRVFSKTMTINEYRHPSIHIVWKDNNLGLASANNVKRIVKNFGCCFVKLSVIGATFIMNSVAKHCVVGTLKELLIAEIKFTEVMAKELKPICSQLQKLTMIETSILSGANVFANCYSLIELHLRCEAKDDYHLIMENHYPKLQRFSFYGSSIDFVEMLNFLERQKTLKRLQLDSVNPSTITEYFFPKLGKSCTELEELMIKSFGYRGPSTLDFSNFQSLKRLKLAFRYKDFATISKSVGLQIAKSLKILEIDGNYTAKMFVADLHLLTNLRVLSVNIDGITKKIQWTWPQLKKLRLTGSCHVDNVVDIIKQLSNLEELQIGWHSFELSEKEFYEIVKLTKGRQNVLTLTCVRGFGLSNETYEKFCGTNPKVKLMIEK